MKTFCDDFKLNYCETVKRNTFINKSKTEIFDWLTN